MSKKRIGILSQNYRRNYGGILQSYALFRTIESFGYDVEIIDFRYNYKDNISLSQIIEILRSKFLRSNQTVANPQIKTRNLPAEHIEAFMGFKTKYQKLSPSLDSKSIGDYVSKYEAIVVGSDQVWNDVDGRHQFFFFDFGKPYGGKKIAYAPCSILTQVKGAAKRNLRNNLKKIDAISVRDETTWRLVNTVSGINPEIVLDPTFLYDFEEFSSKPIVDGDYIFTYILGSEIACGHQSVLEKIFEKYGRIKVVAAIIPDDSLEVEKFADEIMYNAAPDEWVNLIANSKFVYTDSFHGCVFAMKFHKPFFAYYKDARRASRLIDISKTYSLENVKASGEKVSLVDIDYVSVDSIIKIKKEQSLDFLRKNLP